MFRSIVLSLNEKFSVVSSRLTLNIEDFVDYVEFSTNAFAGMYPAPVCIVKYLTAACMWAHMFCHCYTFFLSRLLHPVLFTDVHEFRFFALICISASIFEPLAMESTLFSATWMSSSSKAASSA